MRFDRTGGASNKRDAFDWWDSCSWSRAKDDADPFHYMWYSCLLGLLCIATLVVLWRRHGRHWPAPVAEEPATWGMARASVWVLGGLLVLRFGLLVATPSLGLLSRQGVRSLTIAFEAATFGLVWGFLWLERSRLERYHVDASSGWLLIAHRWHFPAGLAAWGVFRWRGVAWPPVRARVWGWLAGGALSGLAAELAMDVLGCTAGNLGRAAQPVAWSLWLGAIVLQAASAGVMEEPVFRGFLWGALRARGWQDRWIWPAQALLFTAAHAYYLPMMPLGVWFVQITVPGLVLGWVAWRARSITASIVTHGVINATGNLLAFAADKAAARVLVLQAMAGVATALVLGLVVNAIGRRGAGRVPASTTG